MRVFERIFGGGDGECPLSRCLQLAGIHVSVELTVPEFRTELCEPGTERTQFFR